jgi:hypothetical protein
MLRPRKFSRSLIFDSGSSLARFTRFSVAALTRFAGTRNWRTTDATRADVGRGAPRRSRLGLMPARNENPKADAAEGLADVGDTAIALAMICAGPISRGHHATKGPTVVRAATADQTRGDTTTVLSWTAFSMIACQLAISMGGVLIAIRSLRRSRPNACARSDSAAKSVSAASDDLLWWPTSRVFRFRNTVATLALVKLSDSELSSRPCERSRRSSSMASNIR